MWCRNSSMVQIAVVRVGSLLAGHGNRDIESIHGVRRNHHPALQVMRIVYSRLNQWEVKPVDFVAEHGSRNPET